MPSLYNLTSGTIAQAQDVQQIINALNGTVGQGIPLSITAVNDSVNFALAVKNTDTTNSRALQVLRANGTVLLQADVNGLVGSVDGSTTVAQLVSTSLTQTLTNKTLTSPSLTSPSVSSGNLTLAGNVVFQNAPASITMPFAGGASVALDMSGNTLRINNGAASGGVQITGGTSLGVSPAIAPAATGLLVGGATPTGAVGAVVGFGTTNPALGGGSSATLGTIGGSGPTAAAQNSWLQINIAGGNRFIPVWG